MFSSLSDCSDQNIKLLKVRKFDFKRNGSINSNIFIFCYYILINEDYLI